MVAAVAFAVDLGCLYLERRELQTAADAAALAGVSELPADPSRAIAVAEDYLGLNGSSLDERTVHVTSTFAANDTVVVDVLNPAEPLYFAPVFGTDDSPVSARSVAVVQSPAGYCGVMPYGIMAKETTQATGPFGYDFGETVTLKTGSQDGEQGNMQFVMLDGAGDHGGAAPVLEWLSTGGSPFPVNVGQTYFTKTGVNGGNASKAILTWIDAEYDHGYLGSASYAFLNHTFSEYVTKGPAEDFFKVAVPAAEPNGCHRLILCPIIVNSEFGEGDPSRYNWTELNGSKPVMVVGFAKFWIEQVGSTGPDCFVTGRFIRVVDPDLEDLGPVDPWSPVIHRLHE